MEHGISDPLVGFPYPKGGGKLRHLSVATALDLAALRTLVGRVAVRIDSILLPHVFSNRLARKPPGWTYKNPRYEYRRLVAAAMRLIDSGYSVSRTDFARYYQTIPLGTLETNFTAWGSDGEAVKVIASRLRGWGPVGIPIGPEPMGVLGNGYLHPLDVRLAANPDIAFLRYADDVFFFVTTESDREWGIEAIDHEADLLRILRSVEKTRHANGRRESIDLVTDSALASLSYWMRCLPTPEVRARLEEAFDQELRGVPEPLPGRFRYIVKGLHNTGSDFAVNELLQDNHLMNVDPIVTMHYLVSYAPRPKLSTLFSFIEGYVNNPVDEFAGLALHVLRGLKKPWGESEGRLLLKVVDSSCRAPVRAWAAAALAGTPVWSKGFVKERVLEERDAIVRRGLFSTLKKVGKDDDLRPFLRHVRGPVGRRFVPELFAMSFWIQADDLS